MSAACYTALKNLLELSAAELIAPDTKSDAPSVDDLKLNLLILFYSRLYNKGFSERFFL